MCAERRGKGRGGEKVREAPEAECRATDWVKFLS